MRTNVLIIAAYIIVWVTFIIKSKRMTEKMTPKKGMVLKIPKFFIPFGIIGSVFMFIIVVIADITSIKTPHIILYVSFMALITLELYISLAAARRKVFVVGDKITSIPTFGKALSFELSNIVHVKRQVKKNKVKSERMVIRTDTGKKVIVERTQICYDEFRYILKTRIDSEKLEGM